MKITLICDILGKEDNGTTIATMNLAKHLQKNNEVRILCCDKTKKGKPGYYVTDTKKFPSRIGKFVDSTGFQLARVNKKIVKEACEGADVIHCLEPFALSIAATKYARRHNIPVTAAVHLLPEHLLYYLHIRWIVPLN
ncbi:MAG: glycosyltransferase [Mycoplasmoidaceae bacterium]|nr:glycosyltransferase [Mycoplasmoidaceae bacterium]